ncbi:hypothetical protein BHM03_00034263 [Ensete ventricosum]|nr:hypothetical protein BHM03_00034263 [Ensete ventricosum]
MLRPSVTREWVGEGELPKERTQSEMAEALRCASKGHTWRDRSPISSYKNLNAMEMSPGGDMVQWIRWISVESSIPCSHGGRALVVREAEKVENAKANFKYQDKAEGQKSENFIRPLSTGFSSR